MNYHILQDMLDEAVKSYKAKPPSDDEAEQRIIYYLKAYREITRSQSEYVELTAMLKAAGALKDPNAN